MQRIRAALLGSTLVTTMAISGLAFAAPATAKGGVPHGDDGPAVTTKSGTVHAKATNPGPGYQRTLEMQRALKARNIYQGQVDGVWGPKTEAALRNFQTQNGLDATGNLNATTAEKLGLPPERQAVSGTDTKPANTANVQGSAQIQNPAAQPLREDAATNVQLSSLSADQAKELQQRLQLLGYYTGPVDGVLGEGTRTALKHFFQRQAELASKGVVSNAAIGLFGTEASEVQPVNGTDAKR